MTLGMIDTDRYLDADSRLLNPQHRDIEPAAGDRGYSMGFAVKSVDAEKRRVSAVFSTPNVDRYDEIILPSAFEKRLGHFQSNPVLIANHVYYSLDGQPTTIGTIKDLKVTGEGLVGVAEFLKGDALADAWWRRFEQKALRAFSVGFLTVADGWEMRPFKQADGSSKKMRVFTDVELIEISAVSIPANRQALAAASLGARPRNLEPGNPAQDQDAVADVMRRLEALEKAVGQMPQQVEKTIKQTLSVEPGGAMRTFLMDVADVQHCRDSGTDADDGDPRKSAEPRNPRKEESDRKGDAKPRGGLDGWFGRK